MPDVDFSDREVRHRIEAVMVNPFDLSDELGLLPCIVGTLQIDRGYYTDDRCSGSISTASWDGYAEGAWLRIYHVCTADGRDVRYERGTFAISNADISSGAGRTVFELSLMSALGAIGKDYDAWPMAIGRNALASASIRAVCEKCGRPYRTTGMADYRYTSASALEAGKSFRSRLYAICSASGNRLDVDPHGRITVTAYVNPRDKYPAYALDVDDARSVIVDGSVKPGTDRFTRASRSIVVYKDGDKVISAQSDVSETAAASFQRRGFTIAELHELEDMGDPKTVAHAQSMAKSYLKSDAAPTETWELETLWMPLDQGDVVTFAPRGLDPFGDGKARRCLVQSVEETTSRLKLTLKEV